MKYISLFLFVFTSNLALCQTSETDHLESNGFDAKRLSNLTLKLKELSNTKQIPGSVTLITRNNQIVHHEAFGYSDFENKNMFSEMFDVFSNRIKTTHGRNQLIADALRSQKLLEVAYQASKSGKFLEFEG